MFTKNTIYVSARARYLSLACIFYIIAFAIFYNLALGSTKGAVDINESISVAVCLYTSTPKDKAKTHGF